MRIRPRLVAGRGDLRQHVQLEHGGPSLGRVLVRGRDGRAGPVGQLLLRRGGEGRPAERRERLEGFPGLWPAQRRGAGSVRQAALIALCVFHSFSTSIVNPRRTKLVLLQSKVVFRQPASNFPAFLFALSLYRRQVIYTSTLFSF